MFSKLSRDREFSRVLKAKQRLVGHLIIVDWATSPESSPRLGITVSKKFGNSPQRNRFKRIVREAFRKEKLQLPAIDLIIRPRSEASSATSCLIAKELLELTRHAQAKLPAAASC